MTNFVQKLQDNSVQRNRGDSSSSGLFSVRSLTNYVRIVSSGASNVASSVRRAGASIVSSMSDGHDDSCNDQVLWAGFDKLEYEGDVVQQVLLLGYRSGFQVWDVEKADNVRQLVASHDVSASFMQMQKKPNISKGIVDRFIDVRPLLIVAGDGCVNTNSSNSSGFSSPSNGFIGGYQEIGSEYFLPGFVHFYSLRTHEYVHVLKFRSAVFSVRCSHRIIAISQASQMHCFNAATLEREYTILTHPVVSRSLGSGSIGYGPLAVGPRWLAYSGSLVTVSNNCPVSPQDVSPAAVSLSGGSLVAHFARESSKKLAAGMVTLGDIGYATINKYYSELVGESNGSTLNGNSNLKSNGSMHGEPADMVNSGIVVVRDIVSRSVVVQFMAHKSPISALSFDPSGTLLVTASIHGHNINVFCIIPSPSASSEGTEAKGTCIHLYKLQRGITNAVIQDISFSDDSKWIMISSSRGTSHLFGIGFTRAAEENLNKSDFANFCHGPSLTTKTYVHLPHSSCSSKASEQCIFAYGNPVMLSAAIRIKNGNPGLKSTVGGVAAAAAGKVRPISGAIASVFHQCKATNHHDNINSLWKMYYLLVFSPSGSIIQYGLRPPSKEDSGTYLSGIGSVAYELSHNTDTRFVVEAIQKWDVCHKWNRRDRCDNVDIYSDHANTDNARFLPKGRKKGTTVHPSASGTEVKQILITKETHHQYISEVELYTHKVLVPLWVKSKIYFEVLVDQNTKDHCGNSIGEIEIEGISCRTIETKSRLMPVFDSLSPNHQQMRSGSDKQKQTSIVLSKAKAVRRYEALVPKQL
ncbi:autophagy-related protein [Canna indica]|uniref:Autophagy-related protein n=1 Tax=Canna indica TaxID=4628 RepID=A0AAQ3JL53_9LILI|nr:autophagy-related protein [Canna indica]